MCRPKAVRFSMYQTAAAITSAATVPMVSRAPPIWIAQPVAWRSGAAAATSWARMVWLPESQRNIAPKTLHVPRVTMKGGRRR